MVEPTVIAALNRCLNRLRMRQVALVLALQSQGTLSAAAALIGLTQPAATKMLRELEQTIGVPLFERRARQLLPTAAGRCVLQHFGALRGTLVQMLRDLDALDQDGGQLAIGSVMAPSPTLLSRAVVAVQQALPGVTVQVTIDTSDRLLERLDRGEFDVVVGRLNPGVARRDYVSRPLEDEAVAIVVAPQHPLAARRRVRLAELASSSWVLQPHGSPIRELLESEFRLAHLDTPKGLVETAAIFTTANLVQGGGHVGVLPLSVAKLFADYGMLAILPVPLAGRLEPYGTIVRRGRPSSTAAQAFVRAIHASVGTD